MNYNDALNFIEKKQSLGIKPGLARIMSLLESMDKAQDKIKVIHVAGTNGKGTVSSTIAKCLENAGYKVGLFTSPWVIDYREQIQINGEFIPKNVFADYVDKYKNADATEFELLTGIMYKYFADSHVDYAVIECGMGGKGDATNTEKHNLSVITSVAVDHTAFLGDTVEKIALEKSGIIRENSTCVLYPNPDCENVFEKVCLKSNTKLVKISDLGDYDKNNLETVNAVLRELKISSRYFASETVKLPARCEKIGSVLLDGGHNINSALTLAPKLNGEVAVIGMMRDKDVEGYLSLIAPKCKMIIATTPDNPRSMPCQELAEIAKKYCNNVTFEENPQKAVEIAKKSNLSLVCGSFFLAREIRKDLL